MIEIYDDISCDVTMTSISRHHVPSCHLHYHSLYAIATVSLSTNVQAALSEGTTVAAFRAAGLAIVWKHCGVLLRVPIGQDVFVIGNGVVVALGQGGLSQSPQVSQMLLDGALCKRCKVCP
jgi:hypothetical protein